MPNFASRIAPLAALVTVVLVGAGCESAPATDTSTRPVKPRTAGDFIVDPVDALSLGYRVNWAHDLGVPDDQELTAVVVLGDLVVSVEQPTNIITAVRTRDGSQAWQIKLGTPGERFFQPARLDDRIFINSSRHIYTLSAATGKVRRIHDLPKPVVSFPLVLETNAVFGAADGSVYAQDVNSGALKWSYKLTGRIVAQPLSVGFNVFAADANGVYAMLGSTDGTLLWRGRTFGPITASAVADRLGVYVPSEDQKLYALNRATGEDKWEIQLEQPLTASPVVVGLTVYQTLSRRGLVAINAVDGKMKWEVPATVQPVTGDDETLLCATHTSLQRIDAEDGRIDVEVTTLPLYKALVGPDDSLILVTPGGRMLRLNPSP